MKLVRAIRTWLRGLFSAQGCEERLDPQEGERPAVANLGRRRWLAHAAPIDAPE
jgi:hypothetical protein